MNKKQLYESIMRNVSYEVKKALNENEAQNNLMQPQYATKNINIRITEDSYTEGEDPNSERSWIDDNNIFKASSIEKLIQKVGKYYYFKVNNDTTFVFDNDVIIQCITNEDCSPLTDDEIEAWKNGEIEGYSTEIRFSITALKETPVMHDEIVAAGFNSYD